jgi:hypothetical protein
MCKKTKGLHNRIDKCMKSFIENIKLILPPNLKIVACCCGHYKYPMTIILEYNNGQKYIDMVSSKTIPRTRNFYVKDKQGYYYIPEVVKC